MANPKKPSGLGRGLSALLGEPAAPVAAGAGATAPQSAARGAGTQVSAADGGDGPQLVPIEQLQANPRQPRRAFDETMLEDLAQSIALKGMLQPLLVRPIGGAGNAFEIVAGERRWRAAQRARLHMVPVLVRSLSDTETLEIGLIENIQRQDLNPVEEADGYHRLVSEHGHSASDVARLVSKSRSHVANMLRLLDLPPAVRELLVAGTLSAGHARALITTPDPAALARQVVAQGLSVRQTEALATRAKAGGAAGDGAAQSSRMPAEKDADTRALEQDLSQLLGLVVTIDDSGGQGSVTIRYRSLDQLDSLCARLHGHASGF